MISKIILKKCKIIIILKIKILIKKEYLKRKQVDVSGWFCHVRQINALSLFAKISKENNWFYHFH